MKTIKSEFIIRETETKETAERTDSLPQSPWVSVKERMPSVDKDLFGDTTHPSVLVLTASHTGGVSINRWNGREWLYTGDVDYWMPIPDIPEDV